MEDIAPKLLERIKGDFEKEFSSDTSVAEIYKKINEGTATYLDANEFSIRAGEILAGVFGRDLSSDILPDGRMYYNIAKIVVEDPLKNNHRIITDVTENIQDILNKNAGIGIKAIKPELNEDRINGIIDIVSGKEHYDDISYMLNEPVVNFCQSIVDASVRANSDFQYKSGLSPKIRRTAEGRCCTWCSKLAGTYDYEKVSGSGNDVFRRHKNCRCTVEYYPGKGGKFQNTHTKNWRTDEEHRKIEYRKTIGINDDRTVHSEKGINVTSEYERGKFPGQGRFDIEDGYKIETHQEEIRTAQWIHKNLGGDIKLLNESSTDGIKMPDYIWNGKHLELKSTSTEKAANSAIRKGIKQIEENPGGIILNYTTGIDIQRVVDVIDKRMNGSKKGAIPVDIMIIEKGKLLAVLRY